ncbi:unnamed protein product [Cuscuta epithymum]|uniref:Reverse transcriptase zinc-binding domain-containing protein n=1 Tax=Cuscuta epithymum TaxID=186058 RepID=A0AAV0DGK3_9ASTE|nr:unnamed protein product [Cuscuta epithymum]
MHARYPRGDNLVAKPPDSAVWKRICHIHERGLQLVDFQNGHQVWTPSQDGNFSLSSAFQEIRDKRSTTFSNSHIWHKNQFLPIKLFMWKLFQNILPLPENLGRFNIHAFPSQCPFCRKDSISTSHIFYNCSSIKPIWLYYMSMFSIFIPNWNVSHRQICFTWWLEAGTKTIIDIYKHCIPGIISWHIWKCYSSYT